MPTPGALLLPHVSPYDVDFVIPRIGLDIPVGIDPFLLFKSRNPEFRRLHQQLIDAFNSGILAVRRGALDDARRLFDYPEESAIGFGYTKKGKGGSGVGTYLSGLILETVSHSPELQERGVRHVEEMQLLASHIGPDRVSDIAANVLKQFLIEYTQRQADIWQIPLRTGVPIEHVYDHGPGEWIDSHADLPVDSTDGSPILLVPRRLVRQLPWINYDDFLKTEFSVYLSARRTQARQTIGESRSSKSKSDVVSVTRADLGLVERYVKSREQRADEAVPDSTYIEEHVCSRTETLTGRLGRVEPGREAAKDYQLLVLEILNFLFNPDLTDGQPEVRTIDGTERRDIVFTNESDESFWSYVRSNHDGIFLMFETKNMKELDIPAINQTATYLGDRIGRLGVIVTRSPLADNVRRKIFSVWNDSAPSRKVILVLTDDDLVELLQVRCRNGSTNKWMQRHYREFRTAVQ
jgi:hypothetical protein